MPEPTRPAPRPVSRAGRLSDLGALLLVLAGAAGYVMSYVGLERLRSAPMVEFSAGMSINQLADYHRLVAISRWSLAAIAVGVALGAYAWFSERRRRMRPEPC